MHTLEGPRGGVQLVHVMSCGHWMTRRQPATELNCIGCGIELASDLRRPRHEYLVVISREGDILVTPFDDPNAAMAFAAEAGAQWSETYVCKVLSGPLV